MLKKLSTEIIVYGGTNAIKSSVPFLMLPILTTNLTIDEFGILALIEVFILFLFPIISLNIHSSINTHYFYYGKDELAKFISDSVIISFFSFLIILLIFIILENLLIELFSLNFNILLIPVFAFLRVYTQVILGIYQVSSKPKKFALFTLGQTFIDLGLSYYLVVFLNLGYIGRLEGVYFTFFLFSIIALYLLFKNGLLSVPNFKYYKNILNYGLPLIPHAIGGTVMAMSDRYFISYFYTNEEVGIYTASYQISSLMLLIGISINQAWVPMLFGLLKNKTSYVVIIKYQLGICVFYILVAFSLVLLEDILFNFFVDDKFFKAKEYFIWLLFGFLFQSLYFLTTNFLFYFKKTKELAKITIIGAIINIILNFILINIYGTIGVAYATLFTWIIYMLLVTLKSYKVVVDENLSK